MKHSSVLACAFLFLLRPGPGQWTGPLAAGTLEIPEPLRPYVQSIAVDALGGVGARTEWRRIDAGLYRLGLTFDLKAEVAQDDWQVEVTPGFEPTFHWSPHLTPGDKHIIDQHAFRSPALVVQTPDKGLMLVPDLNVMSRGTPARWYMDLDAPRNVLVMGMSDYGFDPNDRLLFVRKPGGAYPAGEVTFGFYLFVTSDEPDLQNPWRRPLAFLWENWGRSLFESGHPLGPDLEPYVRHTYNWAFNTWKDNVWQEFEWNGTKVGAPVFIVNVTQSPNYPGLVSEREFRSIWNQAWFSSLRSASGLYRYGRRTANADLMDKARLTKELALAAPMKDGLFDTVIATEMETVEIEGQSYKRSRGWQTAFWGNSNRNPVNRPAGQRSNRDCRIAPYHVLDMSWTALLMLRWYDELEKDPRLVDYARTYAQRLLTLQDEEGFFPAWLDKATAQPIGILDKSPETSMSVTFLLKLTQITGNQAYRASALKAMDAVVRQIVPTGRWEDFETYWSSSPYRAGALVGKKITRNNMHKQCNFSMFWTTEALYESYQVTKDRKYLQWGRRVLDEMLMTQASWQPPYMYVNVLGGFGVMNCDGEWLDSRESLFAEIILRYGQELDCTEYIQRGLAALRSSFVMMYCPENPRTKLQWEKKHPFFGPADYGFTMENYAHGGQTSPEGAGMGVFTIYDWGNGAAAEAYNRILDHFPVELTSRIK